MCQNEAIGEHTALWSSLGHTLCCGAYCIFSCKWVCRFWIPPVKCHPPLLLKCSCLNTMWSYYHDGSGCFVDLQVISVVVWVSSFFVNNLPSWAKYNKECKKNMSMNDYRSQIQFIIFLLTLNFMNTPEYSTISTQQSDAVGSLSSISMKTQHFD